MKKIMISLFVLVNMVFAAGTVTDKKTRLMWQDNKQLKQGQWQAAIDYCKNLHYAGYSDWRLPTISELESIVDGTSTKDEIGVKNSAFDYYFWSSTPYVGFEGYAWYVNFSIGDDHKDSMSKNYYIRCVRDSK